MALGEDISALIGLIYQGASDPVIWNRALDGLLAKTGSRFVMVSAVDLASGEYSSARFYGPDDGRFLDGVDEYHAHLYQSDPTLRFACRNPSAGFVSTAIALADGPGSAAEVSFGCFTRDVLGVGHSVVRYTPSDDDLVLGVSLHAAKSRGVHSADNIELFLMLFEHLDRAMRLVVRPPDFSSLREARMLIDARGRVRAVSEAAKTLLDLSDGLSIADGRLVATGRGYTARIDAMMLSALDALTGGGVGGAASIPRPSGLRAWLLKASPMLQPPSPFEAFRPAVQVCIVDPEAGPPPPVGAQWADLFGFTPAEIRLTETLLDGERNLRQAADHLCIAHATARVHLRNLFDKAGVRSQGQLARLLMRLGGWVIALPGLDSLLDLAV